MKMMQCSKHNTCTKKKCNHKEPHEYKHDCEYTNCEEESNCKCIEVKEENKMEKSCSNCGEQDCCVYTKGCGYKNWIPKCSNDCKNYEPTSDNTPQPNSQAWNLLREIANRRQTGYTSVLRDAAKHNQDLAIAVHSKETGRMCFPSTYTITKPEQLFGHNNPVIPDNGLLYLAVREAEALLYDKDKEIERLKDKIKKDWNHFAAEEQELRSNLRKVHDDLIKMRGEMHEIKAISEGALK